MADSYAALCARLSAADHEKARRLAADAPPFDAETEAFLRRIFAPAAQRLAEARANTTAA
jgi:hypothetical protein